MTLFVILVRISKDGSGVATLRGVSIVVNNTNPGDKDKIRITKLGHTQVSGEFLANGTPNIVTNIDL